MLPVEPCGFPPRAFRGQCGEVEKKVTELRFAGFVVLRPRVARLGEELHRLRLPQTLRYTRITLGRFRETIPHLGPCPVALAEEPRRGELSLGGWVEAVIDLALLNERRPLSVIETRPKAARVVKPVE